jgi:hypothetical protein
MIGVGRTDISCLFPLTARVADAGVNEDREIFMKFTAIRPGMTAGMCVLVAAAFAIPTAVSAKPDKPENAAQTADGTGCLVRDADGNYHYDATCEWHTMIKRDKDGNIVKFNYRDKGQLPEGAPRPSKAQINNAPWPGCPDGIKEVTSPSGEYRSDCRWGD